MFSAIEKKDLQICGILGMGGFGRVELVCIVHWLIVSMYQKISISLFHSNNTYFKNIYIRMYVALLNENDWGL